MSAKLCKIVDGGARRRGGDGRGRGRGATDTVRRRGIPRALVHGERHGLQSRPHGLQRSRIVGDRRSRPVGSVRARGLRRPLRRAAARASIRRSRYAGLSNQVSSVRRVSAAVRTTATRRRRRLRQQPYPYYPRYGERLYQADVVAVRAVVGPPEQRCWVEQQQVAAGGAAQRRRRDHRRHSGRRARAPDRQRPRQRRRDRRRRGRRRGRRLEREPRRPQYYTQDVQRCAAVPGSAQPSYWDVTYVFRGATHRAQLALRAGRDDHRQRPRRAAGLVALNSAVRPTRRTARSRSVMRR